MDIFSMTRSFPKEEIYALTSQILRSSRSVSANLAEAFRKRRYEKAFVAKLSDSEAEAAETQVWLDYSLECGYITEEIHQKIFLEYEPFSPSPLHHSNYVPLSEYYVILT